MVLYFPLANCVYAIRLMLALRRVAAGKTGEDLPVVMEKLRRRRGSEVLEALVYRPAARSRPARTAVLVPGISELGCYHPRLMALSRSIASEGFLVLTPDIRMFREFRMSPEALDEIQFWFEQARQINGDRPTAKTGLAGISFSGTLALIVAARPEVRGQVAWVLTIGAYNDPIECSRGWFAAGPVTVGPGYYPTRYYARWIIMLAALDMLPEEAERKFLQTVLLDLLLQRPAPRATRDLSPEAARFYRLATMPENEQDPELAQRIESHLMPMLYNEITPHRAAAEVSCPVFLVHGAVDDLIPPEESARLRKGIRSESFLLITGFLTHTHPNENSMNLREKTAAFLELFRFFYNFARIVR